jgi:hypothetical protein
MGTGTGRVSTGGAGAGATTERAAVGVCESVWN